MTDFHFHEEQAARANSPEGRAELEAIRAANKAQATEALRRELSAHKDQWLPGATDALLASPGRLGEIHNRAALAVAIHEQIASGRLDRYRRPELVEDRPIAAFDRDGKPMEPPRTPRPAGMKRDALRAVVDRYKDEFKDPAAAETFYAQRALELSHLPKAEVIERVVLALEDRRNNALLRREVPPSEATMRVVEALRPFDSMLKGRLLDVAEEHFGDLAGPNAPTSVRRLSAMVEGRLKTRSAAALLIDGEFDPQKVVRPQPAAAIQAEPQAPAAEPTWEEANRAAFQRLGI